jgi:hypothetical protein
MKFHEKELPLLLGLGHGLIVVVQPVVAGACGGSPKQKTNKQGNNG